METTWFLLAGFSLAVYVVLDGYDLGAGIVHLVVARTNKERALALRSIGPVWDGNEVWLLALGGTLVLAFPLLYATAFSGFHLPLTLVLWLLVGRALAVELRHQVHHGTWEQFWDAIFFLSSAALVVCFGAALGNVVRGVPLDEHGRFFLPLWGESGPNGRLGVLDGFTLTVSLAAVAAVALHGSLWLAMKLEGAPQSRARRLARGAGVATAVATGLVTWRAWSVQPHIPARLAADPWIYAFPAFAVVGLVASLVFSSRGRDEAAFAGSCAYLLGMIAAVALGLYPYVLPATTDVARSLTVHSAAAGDTSLATGLWWWIPGILLALGYSAWAHRRFRGKVVA